MPLLTTVEAYFSLADATLHISNFCTLGDHLACAARLRAVS